MWIITDDIKTTEDGRFYIESRNLYYELVSKKPINIKHYTKITK